MAQIAIREGNTETIALKGGKRAVTRRWTTLMGSSFLQKSGTNTMKSNEGTMSHKFRSWLKELGETIPHILGIRTYQ